MAAKQAELPDLSPAQREIMEIIWQHGEATANDVRRALSQTRKVSRNTVRTLLERMEDKGWLKHRSEGRTFIYLAARHRQESIGQKVREIVETVCGGSPETLVAALLDYRGLRADELKRIRAMLDEAKGRKGGSSWRR